MIQNSMLALILLVSSLWAALGSGPFVRAGFGISGLFGTELNMLSSEDSYRYIPKDSLLIHYRNHAEPGLLFRPAMVVGWEQSINLALSVRGGIGLAYAGASWDEVSVYNGNGEVMYTPPVDATLDLTYIIFPLETRFMLPVNSGGLCISLGPRFAYLAKAEFRNEVRSTKSDHINLYEPWSVGVGASLGGEVQLRRTDLLIDLRIDAGISNEARDKALELSNFSLILEAGLRLTTRRHKKPKWWPL